MSYMPYKRLKILKRHLDRMLASPLKSLYGMGVRPLHLTLLSLPCGLLGVWFLWVKPLLSVLFLGLYLGLDVLDGTMARATGSVSKQGEMLDFLFDRIIALAFLVSLYLRTGELLLPATGIALILAVSLEDAGLIKR
jgi:phosphatidylglycerophosphate synthase